MKILHYIRTINRLMKSAAKAYLPVVSCKPIWGEARGKANVKSNLISHRVYRENNEWKLRDQVDIAKAIQNFNRVSLCVYTEDCLHCKTNCSLAESKMLLDSRFHPVIKLQIILFVWNASVHFEKHSTTQANAIRLLLLNQLEQHNQSVHCSMFYYNASKGSVNSSLDSRLPHNTWQSLDACIIHSYLRPRRMMNCV
uniref:Uncharacterized protein n=1 Tax=Glossina austeni TaxID=7395 RepID=A0A1A9V424_GLOAU